MTVFKSGRNASGVFWTANFTDESARKTTTMCSIFVENVPGFVGFGDMKVSLGHQFDGEV